MAGKRKPKRKAGGAGGSGARKDDRKGGGKADARRGSSLGEWVRSLLVAFVIFLCLRIFLLETYVIDSGSMEDTLLVGDFLAVNKLAIGPRIPFTNLRVPGYSEPRRGDILVFDPHHEENMTIVKRVVGMPGDTLEMRDKVLYLNGEVHDERYVETIGPRDYHEPDMLWQNEYLSGDAGEDYLGTWDNWGPLVVPADHYFHAGRQPRRQHRLAAVGLSRGLAIQGPRGIYLLLVRPRFVSALSVDHGGARKPDRGPSTVARTARRVGPDRGAQPSAGGHGARRHA